MRKFIISWAILSAALFGAWQLSALDIPHFKVERLLISPAHAQFNGCPAGFCNPVTVSAPSSGWCGLIPAQASLLNCYPFDTAHSSSSTVQDVKGGDNATMSNFSLNGSGPSTNLNNAGSFNGSSTTGTTALAGLPLSSAFTLNMWINTSQSGSSFPVPMTNDNNTTSDNNGFQVLAKGTTAPALGTGYGSGFNNVGYNGGGYTQGTWSMLTWTYDGSTTMYAYNNATSAGPFTINGSLTNGSTNVTFGYAPGYGGYYSGLIAGVAFWNVALTPTQITTLYGE